MSKRAVFLPCIPNANAEVGMWMTFYERWQPEVDELRVCFGLPHGEALKKLVLESTADYVLFCEMDGIIFTQNIVDRCFKMLENDEADIIASERMSCTPEVARIAAEEFHLDYSGLGDHGCNFWPNFFFVKRSLLLQTDLDFGPHGWEKGTLLFGREVQEKSAADTMGWMSLQLRSLTKKIITLPQYHTSPYDLDDLQKHEGIFDRHAQWIHIGSISGSLFEPKTDMERLELTKRLVWQKLCGKDVTQSMKYVDSQTFSNWESAWKELLKL